VRPERILDNLDLPFEVDTYLRSRVKWEWEDNPTRFAALAWDQGKYTILLNVRFPELPVWAQRMLVLHEFLHLIYGDAITAAQKEYKYIWNLAVDTRANFVVFGTFQEEADRPVIGFDKKTWTVPGDKSLRDTLITYEKVAPVAGLPGKHLVPPEVIYELLVDTAKEVADQFVLLALSTRSS
jgi:hypothetical protein